LNPVTQPQTSLRPLGTNIVFGALGVVGMWVMARSSPTARGGDWSDVRRVLFGWVLRPFGRRVAA